MCVFSDVWGAVGYRVGTDGSVWSRWEKQSFWSLLSGLVQRGCSADI
jgi:hypothetical protein